MNVQAEPIRESGSHPGQTPRPCPLCEGKAVGPAYPHVTIWEGRRFHYVRCGTCDCVFVDPVPSRADFDLMYSRENYHDKFPEPTTTPGRFLRSAQTLAAHCGRRRKLLDFGCGNGDFLLAAATAGFECEGVESDSSAIAHAARKTGFPVSDLEALQRRGARYDIIHLGDVFEHLPYPAETIGSLRELLNPAGLFFVEGPLERNPSLVYFAASGLKRLKRKLGRDAAWKMPPWHLTLMDRHAQEAFFTQRMGYKRVLVRIGEDGWPYCTDQRRAMNLGTLARRTIGLAAIALNRVDLGGGNRRLGNRFIGLFEVG